MLTPGWCAADYLLDAASRDDGYETVLVDGVQGSGKSNLSLQAASWVKRQTLTRELGREPSEAEVWEAVLGCLIFTPADFVNTLEAVPDSRPLDVVIWDDIQAHYTSSTFKTDIDQYAAIDATWAVIRTKVHVIIVTIPNIGRLAKNVKDNCTFEWFVGKNRLRKFMRLFRLPGLRKVDMNLFKVDVELPSKFDLYTVPAWAWVRYDRLRKDLANQALGNLKSVTDMGQLEGYISIGDAVALCKQSGVRWGLSTLGQGVSRGYFVGQKVHGIMHLDKAYLLTMIEHEKSGEPVNP
jgi:hypothetical protein